MKGVTAWALAILAAVSLVVPLIEVAVTGASEEFGAYALVQTLLQVLAIFWWYHFDKAARGYRAGPLMNAGVVALALVALPIYFIRSRGWRHGSVAIAKGIVVFAAATGLEYLGEWLGKALTG